MLFDSAPSAPDLGDGLIRDPSAARWRVESEYGRLADVLLSEPPHLEMIPCNSVTVQSIGEGLVCCPETAAEQHRHLVRTLEGEGVRCHFVPPVKAMPDLSFTRDACLMTPWGLLELSPSASHRRAEAAYVRSTLSNIGLPVLGKIKAGHVEGGDVCLLRPGILIVGYSGDRTDFAGAKALAALFEARGWRAILTPFDPHYLHLDTLFTLVDRDRAVACLEALDPSFVNEMRRIGIDLVPVSLEEVRQLGSNLVSLGENRVLSPAGNHRINAALGALGYQVVSVEIDQFARCGGGIHCLTLPLARSA